MNTTPEITPTETIMIGILTNHGLLDHENCAVHFQTPTSENASAIATNAIKEARS